MTRDLLMEIIRDELDRVVVDGGSDCGARPQGGAAHGCRCAHCVSFRRMQLRIRQLNRRRS